MDNLLPAEVILIFLLVAFLALILSIPVLIIYLRAHARSANVSLRQIFGMQLRHTAKKSLFDALALTQREGLDLTFEKLETHLLAGGDPFKVVSSLAKHRSNSEVTFQRLSAIDLAKKDIEPILEQAGKKEEIRIEDFQLAGFRLDYFAVYRRGIYAAWLGENEGGFEGKIREKLESFANSWKSDDPIYTQNFIQSNILNNEYWERVLGLTLVSQSLNVKI